MAVKAVQYAGLNSYVGPSGAIWAGAPVAAVLERPELGSYFFDDFLQAGNADATSAYLGSVGPWSSYGAAGSLFKNGNDTSGTLADAQSGVLNISSDGDNEGVALYSSAGFAQPMTTNSTTAPGYQGKIYFEARFSRSTVAATTVDTFVGLCAPILSTGVPQAANPISTTINVLSTTFSFLGFHCAGSTASTPGGPTEIALAFNKAAGTVNYPTNMTALMAATGNSVLTAGAMVKVGFIFDPAAQQARITSATARQTAGQLRRKLLRVFINGLEAPAFLSSDDLANATSGQAFPIVPMAPIFAVMNAAGTSPGSLSCDWARCLQLRTS